jgi:DNA-binding winged helix-turn-helix (wHTH) protein/tetratricopeptide (TPR) repeat protein
MRRIIPAYNHADVTGSSWQFGPFVADRARYRVVRGDAVVELTPKLLDLLFHLVDRPGVLVTKEELLDALWPDANVTDNALTQAVSELRQALGDDAGDPRFIKTVARRGYRFIATVTARAVNAAASETRESARPSIDAIAVMDFTNVSGDPDSAWLSSGIAETVTGDLRTLGRFRVVDRARVLEAARRAGGSFQQTAADLDAPLVVVGSFQRHAERIRITARIVSVASGEALADAKVDGPVADIFGLQDQVVAQFSKELGMAAGVARKATSSETPSLDAYRAYTEGWLLLEALDTREISNAVANFDRAITLDPRYALAYTGLASAQLAAYEETRSDNAPAKRVLDDAIDHARRAVALDDTLAEAQATLAMVLVSAWETREAVQLARRAVAVEPTNWRHFFRLGHASWGGERLRAAANMLALYPDFAFAHFQIAMVHVARGHLREAETVLRQGAAVQDRQIGRGDRYPALGLHWMLGLVRLAQDDVDEALREFDREQDLAEPHRLYGREFTMSSLVGRGAALLRIGRTDDAADAFRKALALYPDHAQTHLGLSLTLRAAGQSARADDAHRMAVRSLETLSNTRPVEAALVRAHLLAADGRTAEASAIVCTTLDAAAPGFAAWTLPIEPLLLLPAQPAVAEAFRPALTRLFDRAS